MEYIHCWSGGKDSTADVILSHIHNEPHGKIIMSEVMFDKNISGELPEHMEFVHNKAIPLFENWGFEVEILHAEKTYMDCFNNIINQSRLKERNGKRQGFPMALKCMINSRCKIKPIDDYLKSIHGEYKQYVGIAIDEPTRLERLKKDKTQESILAKYEYTEQMAYDLCKKFDLLSPTYEFSKRGGCWFCPNARDCELRHLRKNHADLWNILLRLEEEPNLIGDKWNTLKKTSIHMKEEQFMWEDRQISIFDFL